MCVISELEKGSQPQPPRSSEELEDLHKLLHFPEEVALRLTESEYQLFYQVPPYEYLRHVEQDQTTLPKPPARPPPSSSHSCSNPRTTNSSTQTEDESSWPVATVFSSVQVLINRFHEVRGNRRPLDAFAAHLAPFVIISFFLTLQFSYTPVFLLFFSLLDFARRHLIQYRTDYYQKDIVIKASTY